MRLTKLHAQSVRGIPRGWPAIDICKKGLIIYGSNGTGKSSLVDALENVLINDSSLFQENRTGVNWSKAAPHVIDGSPDIKIELKGSKDTLTISNEGSFELLNDEANNWLSSARNASFILRRYMLLFFIKSEPAERYKAIEKFLNLGQFHILEANLKKALDENIETRTNLTLRLNQVRNSLRIAFELDDSQDPGKVDYLEILNEKLKNINIEELDDLLNTQRAKEIINVELGDDEVSQKLGKYQSAKDLIIRLKQPGTFSEIIDIIVKEKHEYVSLIQNNINIIKTEILEESKYIISKLSLEYCPVCEQEIDNEQVVKRLEERINEDIEITQKKRSLESNAKILNTALFELKKDIGTSSEYCNELYRVDIYDQINISSSELQIFIEILDKIDSVPIDRLNSLIEFKERIINYEVLTTKLDNSLKEIGAGERRNKLIRILSLLNFIENELTQLIKTREEFKRTTPIYFSINKLYEHAVDARKEAVQSILCNVSILANHMYEEIHPNEGINNTKLHIRDTARASLLLAGEFQGKEENPLLHYSESHLDTLGLCYFLSIRLTEAEKDDSFKLLILDDVMHSVDAEHRERIAKMLAKYFSDHQIVITTHDPVFYQKLRNSFGGTNCTYLRINSWNIKTGPILGDPLTDLDNILEKSKYEKLSQETLGGVCGRFMEYLCKELSESLMVNLIARFRTNHTINDLWPPLSTKLRKCKPFPNEIIEKIDNNLWVRNTCSAHYNEPDVPATINEVQELAGALGQLYQLTYCSNPECNNFIKRKENSDWECKCGAINFANK